MDSPPHYLIRAATLMLGAVRVRAAGADARPGPRNRSSDARGSSPRVSAALPVRDHPLAPSAPC